MNDYNGSPDPGKPLEKFPERENLRVLEFGDMEFGDRRGIWGHGIWGQTGRSPLLIYIPERETFRLSPTFSQGFGISRGSNLF
jgi:hypothetical protein